MTTSDVLVICLIGFHDPLLDCLGRVSNLGSVSLEGKLTVLFSLLERHGPFTNVFMFKDNDAANALLLLVDNFRTQLFHLVVILLRCWLRRC